MPRLLALEVRRYAVGGVSAGLSQSRPAVSPVASFWNTWPSLVVGSHQLFLNRYSISISDIWPVLVLLMRAAIAGTSSGLNSTRG